LLIRLVDHFKNNPKRVDKLIAIKGLPKEWMFVEGPNGLELRKPWIPDIDANIPESIRHLCEPTYVTFRYPPIERGQKETIDHRKILGLKLDYNSEPGRELWEQIERYIEESTPREIRLPVPVVCAKDERSAFETYRPRRSATGALEFVPEPVPEIDLSKYQVVTVESKPTPVLMPKEEIAPVSALFKCQECDYEHKSKAGIRMHKVKRHPEKEKVGT
jgi:hypothetical protein